MSKKFLGKSLYRFEKNPKEKVFSNEWIELNRGKYSMIEMLLSSDGGKTPAQVNEHDELIAATVIQWLGSPVGYSWLIEIIKKMK